jgi:protein-disulfide isomerase
MRFPGNPTPVLLALLAAGVPTFFSCAPQDGPESGGTRADTVAAAILQSEAEASPRGSPSSQIPPQERESRPLDVSRMGYDRGSPEAPVRVLEMSDFGCGYCRLFHQETFPALVEAYVEPGLVQWKFIPFVLGMFPNGLEASIAAECSGEQDRFFAMQGRLFSDQAGWKNTQDPFPFFASLAEEEGLDLERFDGCIKGGWREDSVRANIRLGREIGVRGTPTFLIDGVPISGALPLQTFRDILDMALTQKGVTPPARG